MSVLDERFPRWAESVEIGERSARFEALHQAAESVGGGLAAADTIDLVGYACGLKAHTTFAAVAVAVLGIDPSFDAQASDLEPRLVATAAVARAMERGGDTGAIAAGAVLSAEFAGLHSPVAELADLARAAIAKRFQGLREQVRMPHIGEAEPAVVIEQFARRIENRVDASDEELDILWWALTHEGSAGAIARDHDWSADQLLQAGFELAALHRFTAEIPVAGAILRRVLGGRAGEEHRLDEVIRSAGAKVPLDKPATPGPLLAILTSHAEYMRFENTPIDFSADSGGFRQDGWVTSASGYGVDATIRRRGDQIAAQTMRELLLTRAVSR